MFLLSRGGQRGGGALEKRCNSLCDELDGNFQISLRVPVGDYRRLSLFFSEQGIPQKKLFHKIVQEKGLKVEEYLQTLARTYAKNFRNNIEIGIIQPKHGSIINSDIDGKLTDLEDFLNIKKLAPEEIKQYTEDWTLNFFKIVNLADLDETLNEKIMTIFDIIYRYCYKGVKPSVNLVFFYLFPDHHTLKI